MDEFTFLYFEIFHFFPEQAYYVNPTVLNVSNQVKHFDHRSRKLSTPTPQHAMKMSYPDHHLVPLPDPNTSHGTRQRHPWKLPLSATSMT